MIASCFKYLFASIATASTPPRTNALHNFSEVYIFAPISLSIDIFTLDPQIWNPNFSTAHEVITYRSAENSSIKNFRADLMLNRKYLIVGLHNESFINTSGNVGTTTLIEMPFITGFTDIGYEVLDSDGLSALSNIGFDKQASIELKSKKIITNNFGLIDNLEQAILFSQFSDEYAIEHSPFYPIRVMLKKRSEQ